MREREEEERRFSEQLTALHEVTNQLSTTDSFPDLCRAAVELGRTRLGFDRLGIWFVEEDITSATGTFGIDENGCLRDEQGSRVTISPASLAGQVLSSKRPVALRRDAPTMDNRAEVVGRGSHAIAGLWNGTDVIGFISADNLLHHQPITERQCKLLALYASAVGHLCQLKRLEEELRRRAEALAEADRRKDEFLALLAHELRNPLAPILNAVELMKNQGLGIGSWELGPTESKTGHSPSAPNSQLPIPNSRLSSSQLPISNSLSIVDRQVRQMARLVDDLLDVSRITQGRIELRKERVDLTALARSAVETTRYLIEAREHYLTVSLPPEPVWLDADPARLEQILTNLLNNAAKYTEPGGQIWLTVAVEETVDIHRDAQDGQDLPDGPDSTYIFDPSDPSESTDIPDLPHPVHPVHPCKFSATIRVRDTGEGLAPELLSRIFEPFTQADRSLDRSQGGLGIGLTLVQRLVELHGGSVQAHSPGPGHGSEFVVRLPILDFGLRIMDCADKESEVRRSEVSAGADNPNAQRAPEIQNPKSKRVLVVDDNVDAAITLAELLQLWGHEARVVHDGRLALEEAVRYQPEVVLLDIGLPQMDGYEVARRLRQQPGGQALRLVAVTGYGQDEDRCKSQAAGFDHHLVKPVDPDALQPLLAVTVEPS